MAFTSNRSAIQHHRKMLPVCFGDDRRAISLAGAAAHQSCFVP